MNPKAQETDQKTSGRTLHLVDEKFGLIRGSLSDNTSSDHQMSASSQSTYRLWECL
jgi:hypothetical protein